MSMTCCSLVRSHSAMYMLSASSALTDFTCLDWAARGWWGVAHGVRGLRGMRWRSSVRGHVGMHARKHACKRTQSRTSTPPHSRHSSLLAPAACRPSAAVPTVRAAPPSLEGPPLQGRCAVGFGHRARCSGDSSGPSSRPLCTATGGGSGASPACLCRREVGSIVQFALLFIAPNCRPPS